MSNYKSFAQRIDKATTTEQLTKLDTSLDRLWNVGAFTANEFGKLDSKLCDRKDELQA